MSLIGRVIQTRNVAGGAVAANYDIEIPSGCREIHASLIVEGVANALLNSIFGRIELNDGTINVAQNTPALITQLAFNACSTFTSINSTVQTAFTKLRWTYQPAAGSANEFGLIVEFFN